MLEKQERHQDHQYRGHQERDEHLPDGDRDELGGVVGNSVVHAGGKALRQLLERRAHGPRGLQRVGARLQKDTHRHGRLAIVGGGKRVILGTKFGPRHISKPQRAAVLERAQDDALEFLRCGELATRGHGERERLALDHRIGADPAGRELFVLLANRHRHIGRREVKLRQFVRPQPDAHGIVLGHEERGVADARDARQFVDDVQQRVITQLDGALCARPEDRHQEDVG